MPYKTLSALCKQHPGKSGIYPLSSALEAFSLRAQMCQLAQRTLDVQYYIWRQDLTGTLLLYLLRQAADRGVKLRLLLDDFGIGGLDATLAILDQHPNIEVRLVNPFRWRRLRYLNLLTDFRRLNRRMHNKSFSADRIITIVGGRNIGDEYFGAKDGDLFSDLDVAAVGPIVAEVVDDFERYWSSASAVPASFLLRKPSARQHRRFEERVRRLLQDARSGPYLAAANDKQLRAAWLGETALYDWVQTTMLSDSPDKLLGEVDSNSLVATSLKRVFGQPRKSLELVSAYFVPTQQGLTHLLELATRGIRIRVLTNSLEATDVTAVHAGYTRYRKRLLEGGIKLFEMRRAQALPRVRLYKHRHRRPRLLGSAGTSLHSKTAAIDGERIFVGSFNFDPRSSLFNTEMGFVIECPKLAQELEHGFNERVPETAYTLELDENQRLAWTLNQGGVEVSRFTSEPRASLWRRIKTAFFGLLPFESLL